MIEAKCPTCGVREFSVYDESIDHDPVNNIVLMNYECICDHCGTEVNITDSYSITLIGSEVELAN